MSEKNTYRVEIVYETTDKWGLVTKLSSSVTVDAMSEANARSRVVAKLERARGNKGKTLVVKRAVVTYLATQMALPV